MFQTGETLQLVEICLQPFWHSQLGCGRRVGREEVREGGREGVSGEERKRV